MIIITRPKDLAQKTSKKLEAKGFQTLIMPLMQIEEVNINIVHQYDYILITSQNAVTTLAASKVDFSITKVIAIGEMTAARLLDFGITTEATFIDSTSLLDSIDAMIPKEASILYLSGRDISSDLDLKIKAMGYDLRRIICYKAKSAKSLPKFFSHNAKFILFYSTRTAQIFNKLCYKDENLSNLTAICISQNVADALHLMKFRGIITASQPTEESMLSLL